MPEEVGEKSYMKPIITKISILHLPMISQDTFEIMVNRINYDVDRHKVIVQVLLKNYTLERNTVRVKLPIKTPAYTHPLQAQLKGNDSLRVKAFIYDIETEKIVEAKLQEFGMPTPKPSLNALPTARMSTNENGTTDLEYKPNDDLLQTVPTILGTWEVPKKIETLSELKIISLSVTNGKSIDASKKQFDTIVTLSNIPSNHKVVMTIYGKEFEAKRNEKDVSKMFEFKSTVDVSFSTINTNFEVFALNAKLVFNNDNKIIDSKQINVKVMANGEVNETKEVPTKEQTIVQSITIEQLISFGVTKNLALKYLDTLNKTFLDFEINTPLRISHFMAQVLHETSGLYYTSESGKSNSDYKGFKGRGLLMLTTEDNYKKYETFEKQDFTSNIINKQKLEIIPYSVRSAGWFWSINNNLNSYADSNDFIYLTRLINSGFNNYDERLNYLKNCFKVFKIEYSEYDFTKSNGYNDKRSSFAWALWHDPDLNKIGCEKSKQKAIEAYIRFIKLVPIDFNEKNWYNINIMNEFKELRYIEKNTTKVKVIEVAKQRLTKLLES